MLRTIEITGKPRLLSLGRCPECGSKELVTDLSSGEVACNNCGLVINDMILDQQPEWKAFTLEETRANARVGLPTALHHFDKGLSTTFLPYRDAHGRRLSTKKRLDMMRLRRWDTRARMNSSGQRNLSQAMSALNLLTDNLNIPDDVREKAALIYRRAFNKGLIRGRSIKSFAAASLYAACRLTRIPRSLNTIVDSSSRSRKGIARNYRLLMRELDLTMPIDDPTIYVSKIASQVRLSQKTQNTALTILEKAKKLKADVGKDPAGLAAAALYIAVKTHGEKGTQKQLAKAADVTEVTVRNRYKGLVKDLGLRV
jgi:transcription initiation factor TFIIB